MIRFRLAEILHFVSTLEADLQSLSADIAAGNGSLLLPVDRQELLNMHVTLSAIYFRKLGVPHAETFAVELLERFGDVAIPWNVLAAHELIRAYLGQVFRESDRHTWARIDADYREYIGGKEWPAKPWGDHVFEVFTDARLDICHSGQAMGAELYTAAVFHLMRVSEYGLRRLARKLGVKLTDKGKRLPIDYATWGKVIEGCKQRITKARALPHGPVRQRRLEQYARATDHCDYFREMWRNDVSHTHRPYIKPEAEVVLQRVREFMQFLAEFT